MITLFAKYFKPLFFTPRFFVTGFVFVLLFLIAYFVEPLLEIVQLLFLFFLLLLLIDYILLFIIGTKFQVNRNLPKKLSNGFSENVALQIKSKNFFPTAITVLDELPIQLQDRNFYIRTLVKPWQTKIVNYAVRPVTRGVYSFGKTHLFVRSSFNFLQKKITFNLDESVQVYPAFTQLKNQQLQSNIAFRETGVQKLRKIGQSMEFEKIKEYVVGDDVRSFNWKATARKGQLMVNTFMEEKSQRIYLAIDKGRQMKMPFNDLTLLDYAINATLALSNVCLQKQDRVGLFTFSKKVDTWLQADKRYVQQKLIMEALYNQKTDFLESNFESFYKNIRHYVKQRSFIILFSNFESQYSLSKQMKYLQMLAKYHLVLVVFFENSILSEIAQTSASTLQQVYTKTIAEQGTLVKKLMVKELNKNGILTLLTKPENLTVNIINKYLEVKKKQML